MLGILKNQTKANHLQANPEQFRLVDDQTVVNERQNGSHATNIAKNGQKQPDPWIGLEKATGTIRGK
jgi:hypothetical protein